MVVEELSGLSIEERRLARDLAQTVIAKLLEGSDLPRWGTVGVKIELRDGTAVAHEEVIVRRRRPNPA